MQCTNVEVSVIMLTYNRENLVGNMIECILRQTFKNFEFIIVDNGSTDTSGMIADEYAQKDNRIKVIHRKCGNIGSGRNAGLDAATGKYIIFVDDDDICNDDFVEFLYNLITENHADISICGATWSDKDEKIFMDSEEAMERLLWRKDYNVAFPTKCIKSELFKNNRFSESGKYDDIYLMPKIIAAAGKIAYHGLSKYHFNRHDNNNSMWTQNHSMLDLKTLEEYLEVYRDRTQWLVEKYPDNAIKWRYFNFSFMLSMVEKITRYDLKDCYQVMGEMKKKLAENSDEFLNGGYCLDFEKEWMDKYVLIK